MCDSCASGDNILTYNELSKNKDSLTIREGILSQHAQKIKYQRNGKTLAWIELSEPVLVAQAEQEEKWGYFQFPSIGRTLDGDLIVKWSMNEDSHKSYGKKSDRNNNIMISKDGGKTWIPQESNSHAVFEGYNVLMSNGNRLQVSTPTSKAVKMYKTIPNPIIKEGRYTYYRMKDLPYDLQGVYFTHTDVNNKNTILHSELNDSNLLRCSIDGSIPVVWWGNIKQLADETLLAGVYPARYIAEDGTIVKKGVAFYKSADEGKSWNLNSKILYENKDNLNYNDEGEFTEPTFEILSDSTLICVMRSGWTSPMYRSYSIDMGSTWTRPDPFTPNGVLPWLKLMKNGVLVLVSGRPGVQIRFSFDGTGYSWSDPIDMIPFMKKDGTFDSAVSCGYVSLLALDNESFLIAYSDFTTKDILRRPRKSIWCRKVTVKK